VEDEVVATVVVAPLAGSGRGVGNTWVDTVEAVFEGTNVAYPVPRMAAASARLGRIVDCLAVPQPLATDEEAQVYAT
jgi:hypothetical protein